MPITSTLEMTPLKEWIGIRVKNREIGYFEYENFKNIERVGEGAFGVVNKADLNDGKVALKSSLNDSDDQKENFLNQLFATYSWQGEEGLVAAKLKSPARMPVVWNVDRSKRGMPLKLNTPFCGSVVSPCSPLNRGSPFLP